MPNKTIYVSDDDMPLYRRAQELAGGNLSSAIATALKKYVELEEGRKQGFDEITVQVGHGAGRKVRFSAQFLGEWGHSSGNRIDIYRVYRTPKDKFAVHTEHSGDWVSENPDGWRSYLGLGSSSWGRTEAEYMLDVADSLDDLRDMIPAKLFEMVADAAKRPPIEDLDI